MNTQSQTITQLHQEVSMPSSCGTDQEEIQEATVSFKGRKWVWCISATRMTIHVLHNAGVPEFQAEEKIKI